MFQSFIHDIFQQQTILQIITSGSITRMNAAFVQHFLEKKISLQKLSGTAWLVKILLEIKKKMKKIEAAAAKGFTFF